MRVLFIGDVVGSPGRKGLRETMPSLREAHAPDLIVVNGENSAGGMGITERTANDLFDAGTGVITTGNHVYRHRDAYDFLEREQRVVRPGQLPGGEPRPRPHRGRGRRHAGRGDQSQRRRRPQGRALPLRHRRRHPRPDRGRRGDRRLPRRGDQREGGDGLAPRRAGRGGARHPHPRADRRRPGAAARAPRSSPTSG